MKRIINLFLLVVLALFFVAPMVATAQESGLQISPLSFEFNYQDGSDLSGTIVVTNLEDKAINYQLETEDFKQVSDDGAPSFAGVPKDNQLPMLSSWIKFDGETSGEIAARKSIEVDFQIDVPNSAEPGGHYAAIFVKKTVDTDENKTEIGVSSRVGSLILLSVPGDVTRTAEIEEFSTPSFVWKGPIDLNMRVKNSGNVHYDSSAKVAVEPILGKTDEVDMGTHTIVPSNSRNYSGTWTKRFPFGYYTLKAQALDGDGNLVEMEKGMWALPLEIVIPLIVLIILIIWTVKIIKRRYRIVSKQ